MHQPISSEQPPKLKIKFNRRRRRKCSFFHGRNLLFPRRKSCPRARLRYHLSGSPLTQESAQHLHRQRGEAAGRGNVILLRWGQAVSQRESGRSVSLTAMVTFGSRAHNVPLSPHSEGTLVPGGSSRSCPAVTVQET